MNLQVLVTCMHEKDMDLYRRMNLHTDAVIANQADDFSYREEVIDGHIVRMMTTPTRGLSRNRNIALGLATAEYLLFSDDDLVFNDDYEEKIAAEFERHHEAEAIKFSYHNLSETRQSIYNIKEFGKATRRNIAASGVCALAVKRDALIRRNLHFHEYFGTGTENYCGEDTIFIQNMINRHVKFYRSPVDIAGIDQTESTWFEGFTEKYFTVAGRMFGTIYHGLSYLLALRSAYRFRFKKRSECKLGFWKMLKCYYRGIWESGRYNLPEEGQKE